MPAEFGARQADLAMDDVGEVGAGQRARPIGFLIVPASAIEAIPLSSRIGTLIAACSASAIGLCRAIVTGCQELRRSVADDRGAPGEAAAHRLEHEQVARA